MWASARPRRRDDARASRRRSTARARGDDDDDDRGDDEYDRREGVGTGDGARAGAPRATRSPLVVTTTSSVRDHRTPPFVWQHLEQLGEPPRERAARLGRAEEEHVPLLALEQVRRRA